MLDKILRAAELQERAIHGICRDIDPIGLKKSAKQANCMDLAVNVDKTIYLHSSSKQPAYSNLSTFDAIENSTLNRSYPPQQQKVESFQHNRQRLWNVLRKIYSLLRMGCAEY